MIFKYNTNAKNINDTCIFPFVTTNNKNYNTKADSLVKQLLGTKITTDGFIEHKNNLFFFYNYTKKTNPTVIVGHDYRSYSEEVKKNFIDGLISAGCNVEDVGMCLSPTIYFSQFDLKTDAVAMITASHNENGWTGIKMGIEKGLTHCLDEMKELKEIVLNKKFIEGKGTYKKIFRYHIIYL